MEDLCLPQTPATCGDGNVDPGELCDDGNDVDDDLCTNACTLRTCGDGVVDRGEACDDDNEVEGYSKAETARDLRRSGQFEDGPPPAHVRVVPKDSDCAIVGDHDPVDRRIVATMTRG